MATKKNQTSGQTNFDVWKEQLTPRDIADRQFVTLSCMGCPAYGKTCNRYDTACRANFMRWARAEAKPATDEPEPVEEVVGDA
jgi:hypothetical protein